MNLKTKIGLAILGIILFCFFSFIIYKQYQINKGQEAIQNQITEMKQLSDGTARAKTDWATKEDLENLGKKNNVDIQVIKDDLKTLNASLTAVNISSVKSTSQTNNNIPSTSTTPNPNPQITPPIDIFGYFNNRQVLKLDEKFSEVSVPIGEVGFSSWQEKPWDINLLAREYKAVTVLGTDENQKQYAYNKFFIKVNDKEYAIKINNNTFTQEYPVAKFSFWNPRLMLTAGGGVSLTTVPIQGSANAGLALGIMNYGKFRNNPDLSILQLGMVYQTQSQRPAVILNPINLNLGMFIPGNIVKNTYLGPSLQVDTSGALVTGLNLSVGL